jgi:hypothetical protein
MATKAFLEATVRVSDTKSYMLLNCHTTSSPESAESDTVRQSEIDEMLARCTESAAVGVPGFIVGDLNASHTFSPPPPPLYHRSAFHSLATTPCVLPLPHL